MESRSRSCTMCYFLCWKKKLGPQKNSGKTLGQSGNTLCLNMHAYTHFYIQTSLHKPTYTCPLWTTQLGGGSGPIQCPPRSTNAIHLCTNLHILALCAQPSWGGGGVGPIQCPPRSTNAIQTSTSVCIHTSTTLQISTYTPMCTNEHFGCGLLLQVNR